MVKQNIFVVSMFFGRNDQFVVYRLQGSNYRIFRYKNKGGVVSLAMKPLSTKEYRRKFKRTKGKAFNDEKTHTSGPQIA